MQSGRCIKGPNTYGSGWESNPPRPLLQHPSDGFEDRGAHRDSTTPKLPLAYPVFSNSSSDCGAQCTAVAKSSSRASAPVPSLPRESDLHLCPGDCHGANSAPRNDRSDWQCMSRDNATAVAPNAGEAGPVSARAILDTVSRSSRCRMDLPGQHTGSLPQRGSCPQ